MANTFRSKKGKNGKRVSYPLSKGMSHKSAEYLKGVLEREFPDESVRVLPLDKRKKGDPRKRYAPFISYLFEDIKNWLPIENKFHIEDYVPVITGEVLKGVTTPTSSYYVFLDPSEKDIMVFGKSRSEDLSYFINWPNSYPGDGRESVIMMRGEDSSTLQKEFQMDVMKTRIKDEMSRISQEQESSVVISDFEASQVKFMLSRYPPDTVFEVNRTENDVSFFPVTAGGDSLVFRTGDVDLPPGVAKEARSFFKAESLEELLRTFELSGSPNMTLSLNEKNAPIIAEFNLYNKMRYTYGLETENTIKSVGIFSAIILPAESDPDAVRLPYQ